MSWRDTISGYLDKRNKASTSKDDDTKTGTVPATSSPAVAQVEPTDAASDSVKQHQYPPENKDSAATAELVKPNKDARDQLSAVEAEASSNEMSRKPSFVRYKEQLTSKIPVGQFDIENATGLPLNISLNHVGPIYYDVVKPGEVFSRQTGKVWFTIEIRLHLGPASEYNKWSVAWPIMLVAGPSAAAISLAAIPIVAIVTGTASITALVTTAVEGVTAAFSSIATGLGVANKLPFASKYRSKAVSAAKAQAADAQKFAGSVIDRLREKGGVQGFLDEWKSRGGEPKLIEMPEQPVAVHDVTDVNFELEGLAVLLDTKGPGPKGWKKKRWQKLKEDLEHVTLVDRGWYAGREPCLRVVGGPRLVRLPSAFPSSSKDETRTILEIYPLILEKVAIDDGAGPSTAGHEVVATEVARGEGSQRDTGKVVEEAAEALRGE